MGNGLWLMPESWHRSNRKPLVSLIFFDGAIQVLYCTSRVSDDPQEFPDYPIRERKADYCISKSNTS